MGPSGSGKSSLLAGWPACWRAVSARGRLRLDGRELQALPIEQRRIGLLFQDDLLFPHLSVLDNLLFALPAGPRAERRARAEAALARADLAGFGRGSRPACRAGSERASRCCARCSPSRAPCCSTSRSRASMPRCAHAFATGSWRTLAGQGIATLLVTHDAADVPPGSRVIELRPPEGPRPMLDRYALALLRPGLTRAAQRAGAARRRADQVTLDRLRLGMAAALAIANRLYLAGLALLLAGRARRRARRRHRAR